MLVQGMEAERIARKLAFAFLSAYDRKLVEEVDPVLLLECDEAEWMIYPSCTGRDENGDDCGFSCIEGMKRRARAPEMHAPKYI